ncbi:aegerolysin family protein [Bartonella bovis]|uniref:aegerolysin family protein n=1 Tax=Bartonella bovis TaxID=155194 RepID=UPI0003B3A8B9|nr:aegerolysin family protein [Bartonella bovis]
MNYKYIAITMIAFIISGCTSFHSENTKNMFIDARQYKDETKAFDDRSTDVTIVNNIKGTSLVPISYGLSGGEWKRKPGTIESGQAGKMGTTSNAWLTGAGGWVKYQVQDDGTILTFKWNNPYTGKNSYSVNSSDKDYFFTTKGTGKGNNATMTWNVNRKSSMKDHLLIIAADPQAWRLDYGDPNSTANRDPWIKTNTKVAQAIKSHRADFHLVNGDLTEFGRPKTYTDYKNVYNIPNLYEGLGNHDYANNVGDCTLIGTISRDSCAMSAVTRMLSEINKYETQLPNFNKDVTDKFISSFPGVQPTRFIEGSLSYSWDYGDIHYVQLQNFPIYTVHMSDVYFSINITKSLDWLEKDLKAAADRGKTTILNFHDARRHVGDHDSHFIKPENIQDLTKFKSILARYDIAAIFVGHTHVQSFCQAKDDKVFGNIPVYTAGALYRGDYYLLDVKGKSVNVKAYNGKNGTGVVVRNLGFIGDNQSFSNTCSNL